MFENSKIYFDDEINFSPFKSYFWNQNFGSDNIKFTPIRKIFFLFGTKIEYVQNIYFWLWFIIYELMPTLNCFQPFFGWFILILDVSDGNFGIFLSISRDRISPNEINSFVFASFLDLFSSDNFLWFLFLSPLLLSASTGKNLFLYLSTIGIESCGNKRAVKDFWLDVP